jgi:hypothetical protein
VIALLTHEQTADVERRLGVYSGKQVQAPTMGPVPSWDTGLLRGLSFDESERWSGIMQKKGAPLHGDVTCHVDLTSAANRDITLTFQVDVEDASTSVGPKYEDYAVRGKIAIASPGLVPFETSVTANLHAYCVDGRLSRDSAYSPAGRRCQEHDVTGVELGVDSSEPQTFSQDIPREMLFEHVDAPGSNSEHVVYEVEVAVDGRAEQDPIGRGSSFRFDFDGAFRAQGGNCF